MCFKRTKEPVKLYKKEETNKLREYLDMLNILIRIPEFWLIMLVVIASGICIILALHEPISYMYYNRHMLVI